MIESDLNVIHKYERAINSKSFIGYEKNLSKAIISAIAKEYSGKPKEIEIVKIIETIVNEIRALTFDGHSSDYDIMTKSIFIHGNKSYVEFDYYGDKKTRELGDIIFIISIIYDKMKYFEKFTITQFKKDNKPKKISWNMENNPQLYLLSRFPSFKGVQGSLIPMTTYNLRNFSGCLGSYGLLFKPGDFAFVSAPKLDSFIGVKPRMKWDEFHTLLSEVNLHDSIINNSFNSFYYWWKTEPNLFGNYHHSFNVYDFISKYLSMGIGEPTFMKIGDYNQESRDFLLDLFSALKQKEEQEETEESKELKELVNQFFNHKYADTPDKNDYNDNVKFDSKGGGIGIVHTTMELKNE